MGKMKRSLYEELVGGLKDMQWQRMNDGSHFVYHDEEGYVITLNGLLLKKQDVNGNNLKLLCQSHSVLKKIKELMAALDPVEHKEQLRRLWKLGDSVEAFQQELWKFDVDPNYRMFWRYPYCTCPTLDNEERWGTGYYIINKDCILHGGSYEQS